MKVEPIRHTKDIKNLKRLLSDSPRDLLLFILGINTGLRVQDLLKLKVADLMDKAVGDSLVVREQKTGKSNVIVINKEIKARFDEYVNALVPEADFYLFKSRKGVNYSLTTHAVTKLVKKWCAEINLQGNFGAHTLRKTWCFQQRKAFGTSWELIAQRLNHSNPSVTRRYLGVQTEEVEQVLMHTI